MLCDRVNLLSDPVFIGMTLFKDRSIARLRPIAEARNGKWHVLTDVMYRFPEEGTIFSRDPSVVGKEEGYIVLFTVVPNERFQPGFGKDQLMTNEVCEPYEIVKTLATMPADRRLPYLATTGFDRGLQSNNRVIFTLPHKQCVFPKVTRLSWNERWGLSHDVDLAKIPVYEEPEGLDGGVKISGRYFAVPGTIPHNVVGALNWQSDTELLETLFKFLKRTAGLQPGSDLAGLSKTVQQRLHAVYREAGIILEDPTENAAILERLGQFLTRLDAQTEIIERIAREVYENPHVRSALADLSEEDRRHLREKVEVDLRRELRAEVDKEIAASRDTLQVIQGDIRQLEQSRSTLEAEIETLLILKETELHAVANTMEGLNASVSTFSGHVCDIMDAARHFGLAPPMDIVPMTGIDPSALEATVPWARRPATQAENLRLEDLRNRATNAARQAGLRPNDIKRLDVLARAGEIPLLHGPAAEALLATYANVVAGGDLQRMPIDPTVLAADDLWMHPTRRTPTPLASAWKDAEDNPGATGILCLDDVDAASLTAWFPRFRRLFQVNRPRNLLIVATSSERAKDMEAVTGTNGCDTIVDAEFVKGGVVAAISVLGKEPIASRLAPPHRHEFYESDFERLKELAVEQDTLCASLVPRLISLCATARSWMELDEAFAYARKLLATSSTESHSPAASRSPGQSDKNLRTIA